MIFILTHDIDMLGFFLAINYYVAEYSETTRPIPTAKLANQYLCGSVFSFDFGVNNSAQR